MKAYQKPLTRNIEEGTFIVNYQGEILDSKNKWHQTKIIRTTVIQGGAEMVGGQVQRFQRDGGSRTRIGGADVGGEAMIVRSVEPAVGPQITTRSQTTARLQRQ